MLFWRRTEGEMSYSAFRGELQRNEQHGCVYLTCYVRADLLRPILKWSRDKSTRVCCLELTSVILGCAPALLRDRYLESFVKQVCRCALVKDAVIGCSDSGDCL